LTRDIVSSEIASYKVTKEAEGRAVYVSVCKLIKLLQQGVMCLGVHCQYSTNFMAPARDVVVGSVGVDDHKSVYLLVTILEWHIRALSNQSVMGHKIRGIRVTKNVHQLLTYLHNITWRIESDANALKVEQVTIEIEKFNQYFAKVRVFV